MMKHILATLLLATSIASVAQNLSFESAKFHFGDDPTAEMFKANLI